MRAIHVSLLLHFIGIGMVFTTILAGWILEGQYRKAADWQARAFILKMLRPIGLLSPVSVLILLLSGIGNMSLGFRAYSLFSDSWLTTKLVVFLILVLSGLLFGIRGTKRSRLVSSMADGSATSGAEMVIKSMDAMQRLFLIIQAVLIVIILTLSIVKPVW